MARYAISATTTTPIIKTTNGVNTFEENITLNKCETYRLKFKVRSNGIFYYLFIDENSDDRYVRVPESSIFRDALGNPIDASITPIAECQVPSMMGSPMVNTMTNGMANTMVAETKSDVASTNTSSVLNWKTLVIVAGVIAVGYYLIKKKIIKIK
jgi:hypothetical protein